MAAGLDEARFWQQTVCSYNLVVAGAIKQAEHQIEAQIVQAHWVERLAREHKLRPVSHYLRKRPQRAQTPKEMLEMLKAMGAGSDMKIRKIELKGDN